MIRFLAFSEGKPTEQVDLSVAYLFGSDGVPLRAEIEFKDGTIQCKKRTAGPAGLALLWPIGGTRRVILDTVRLQERGAPFVLPVELVRGQLMHIDHKIEDWGLFDCVDAESLTAQATRARQLLIQAMKVDDPVKAAQPAEKALVEAAAAAEEMTRYHAAVLLDRRKQTSGFTRRVFGGHVDLGALPDAHGPHLVETCDFATVPMPWKQIEPSEQTFDFKLLDEWVDWLSKQRVPIKGAPLVCFQESCVPDWLYIWEHDFDTVRDLVAEHIRRLITRYGNHVQAWDVISGIHANQSFSFNFEQLIELTRVAATVTKQMAPRCLSIIDIVAPWGEYYARNQRTIPPMLYAEMAVQSGINFDAFGLQFRFGADGMYARDMFQISSLIDRFGAFGKPIHITAVEVPSVKIEGLGTWQGPWNESTQAQWLREFYTVALSKPFVDTVSWRTLADAPGAAPLGCGLLNADMSPKPAYAELLSLRTEIVPDVAGGP